MKKRLFAVVVILGLGVGTASAQFGFGGIVYDPTNYANAALRYNELVQQLAQLRQTYTQILNQYKHARSVPAPSSRSDGTSLRRTLIDSGRLRD